MLIDKMKIFCKAIQVCHLRSDLGMRIRNHEFRGTRKCHEVRVRYDLHKAIKDANQQN